MLRRAFVLSWVLVLFVAPAAMSQADLSEVVTFGDSLTHNDLLWTYYGNPKDLYGKDPMEAAWSKGAVSGDTITNYAVAGSESSELDLQVDLFLFLELIGTQDRATLFNVEIGGNDVLNNINLLATYPPGQNSSADAVIDGIINNLKDALVLLRTTHWDAQFVVWTVPDVTVTPDQWNHLDPTQIGNVRAHLERVNSKIRWLDNLPFVVVFDTYNLLQMAVANPPVLFGHQLVGPPASGGYDHIFADDIHPTAVSNAFFANFIIYKMNSKWNDDIPGYSNEELADLAHIPH